MLDEKVEADHTRAMIEPRFTRDVPEAEHSKEGKMIFPRTVGANELRQSMKEFGELMGELSKGCHAESRLVEILRRVFFLIQTNIWVDHSDLELLMNVANNSVEYPTVSETAFEICSAILCFRPQLGIEVIDSAPAQKLMSSISKPMQRLQQLALKTLIGSKEVAEIVESKYGFVTEILNLINNPNIELGHLIYLYTVLEEYILTADSSHEFCAEIFQRAVFNQIQNPNAPLFEPSITTYKYLLEHPDGAPRPLVSAFFNCNIDSYLLSQFHNVTNNAKQQILQCFIQISAQTMKDVISLYDRNIAVLSELLPLCQGRDALLKSLLDIAYNFISIGPHMVGQLAEWGFVELAFGLLENASSFSGKKTAILFFCGVCFWCKEEEVKRFVIENKIASMIVQYLSVPRKKMWNGIVNALVYVMMAAEKDGGVLFEHRLFEGIDWEELYGVLSEIVDNVGDEDWKGLYANALNLLDRIEPSPDEGLEV
jgi:hypothetical protein